MDLDCYNCPICVSDYDQESHEPRVIPSCGHSLCVKCLSKFLKENQRNFRCPLCNQSFRTDHQPITVSSFPKNFLAMNLIDNREKHEVCPDHRSLLELVCVTCKKKICNKCAFKGDHRDHEVDIQEDFISGIEDKVKDIERWAKEVEWTYGNIRSVIESKRKNLKWMIEIKFHTLYELLEHKRASLTENIDQYFNQLLSGNHTLSAETLQICQLNELRNRLVELLNRWKEKPRLEAALDIHFENLEGVVKHIKNQINDEWTSSLIQSLDQHKIEFEGRVVETIENLCKLDCGETVMGLELKSQNSTSSFGSIDDILSAEFSRAFESNISNSTLFINSNSRFPDSVVSRINQQNLEKIKEIKIKVSDSAEENDFTHSLIWIFNSIPHAESVEVSLRGSAIDKEKLSKIFGGISSLFKLKELIIDIGKCESFDDEDLITFSEALSTLSQIHTLKLNLTKCPHLTNTGLRTLGASLKNLKHLDKLVVNLKKCIGLSENALTMFNQSLGEVRQLSSLELVVDECINFTDESLVCLANSLSTLHKLSKINMSFSSCKITSKGFQPFANGLSELTRVTQLCLFLDKCTLLRNEDLHCLSQSLKKMKSLMKIYLNFHGCRALRDDSMGSIFESLSQFEYLSLVHIDVESCSLLTNQTLLYAAEFFRIRQGIIEVVMSFSKCTKLDDIGVEPLLRSLSNLQNLQMLNLSFMGCNLIKGLVQDFGNLIFTNLGNLIHLTLDLEGCKMLDKAGMIFLFNSLMNLPQLKRLRVYLKGCLELDDNCLLTISAIIEQMKQLSSIHFDLDECGKISDHGVFEIARVLREQENSSKDDIVFSIKRCPSVSPNAIYNLGLEIANLKRDANERDIDVMFTETLSLEN